MKEFLLVDAPHPSTIDEELLLLFYLALLGGDRCRDGLQIAACLAREELRGQRHLPLV